MQIENYVSRPRDSVREREIAAKLRQLPEEERFKFISDLLAKDLVVGLMLASACLRSRKYFEAILDRGLKTADASYMKLWLKCVIPRLGFRRVVSMVTNRLDTEPKGVEHAAYWLRGMVPRNDPASIKALSRLIDLMRKKGMVTP